MTMRIALQLLLAAVLMAFLPSAAYATGGGNAKGWGNDQVPPVWSIFKNGTAKSIRWKIHRPNPRFAIYNGGTRHDQTDDLVWDGETGLVWERAPDGTLRNFDQARAFCFQKVLGGRLGHRVPTLEELASLVDPTRSNPALPQGHPFVLDNLVHRASHQSSTTAVEGTFPPEIWYITIQTTGEVGIQTKASSRHVWCVRGGQEYDGNSDI